MTGQVTDSGGFRFWQRNGQGQANLIVGSSECPDMAAKRALTNLEALYYVIS